MDSLMFFDSVQLTGVFGIMYACLTDQHGERMTPPIHLTVHQRYASVVGTTEDFDISTKFLNKTLHEYFSQEGIEHQISNARTPEQNGVVKRWNRTLVEAARTMLSAAKIYLDGENLDKMKEKGDACTFVRYSTQSKGYRVYNKRTRLIVKTIHEYVMVNKDEFINIFDAPSNELEESSSRHLEIDGEMCMFALTVSCTESKNIKESMADYAWIEAMQEELHQFE
nr:hypothetical protein [Tanacetum cinerariifolium]